MLTDLAYELLLIVFERVELTDLLVLSCVCTLLRDIIKHERLLTKRFTKLSLTQQNEEVLTLLQNRALAKQYVSFLSHDPTFPLNLRQVKDFNQVLETDFVQGVCVGVHHLAWRNEVTKEVIKEKLMCYVDAESSADIQESHNTLLQNYIQHSDDVQEFFTLEVLANGFNSFVDVFSYCELYPKFQQTYVISLRAPFLICFLTQSFLQPQLFRHSLLGRQRLEDPFSKHLWTWLLHSDCCNRLYSEHHWRYCKCPLQQRYLLLPVQPYKNTPAKTEKEYWLTPGLIYLNIIFQTYLFNSHLLTHELHLALLDEVLALSKAWKNETQHLQHLFVKLNKYWRYTLQTAWVTCGNSDKRFEFYKVLLETNIVKAKFLKESMSYGIHRSKYYNPRVFLGLC